MIITNDQLQDWLTDINNNFLEKVKRNGINYDSAIVADEFLKFLYSISDIDDPTVDALLNSTIIDLEHIYDSDSDSDSDSVVNSNSGVGGKNKSKKSKSKSKKSKLKSKKSKRKSKKSKKSMKRKSRRY